MNKSEMIDAVASKSGLSKADAAKAVAAIFDSVIPEALASGDKVTITGFGNFSVKERAARQGFNPITKQPIQIAASKAAKFAAGVALKGSLKA